MTTTWYVPTLHGVPLEVFFHALTKCDTSPLASLALYNVHCLQPDAAFQKLVTMPVRESTPTRSLEAV